MTRDVHNTWGEQATKMEQVGLQTVSRFIQNNIPPFGQERRRAVLEKERYEREMEEERQAAVVEERQAAERRKREEKQASEHLKKQMEEMRKRDDEAEELKHQQDELIRQQWQLQHAVQ